MLFRARLAESEDFIKGYPFKLKAVLGICIQLMME